MAFQNRQRELIRVVDERGSVEVGELARLLGISDMTIRRDLQTLAAQGFVVRTHGGAMSVARANPPVSFVNKAAVNADRKDYICRLAAELIQDNDVIFMDCGSTVFRLCPFIRHKPITVITNSLPVISELLNSSVTLNLVGGEVDKERQAVHGLTAESHISRYQADRAFIGVDGLSMNGLSANSEVEAALTLALMRQSAQTLLLCDSTKLDRAQYILFAPLSAVHTLITDADVAPALIERYEQAGISVVR